MCRVSISTVHQVFHVSASCVYCVFMLTQHNTAPADSCPAGTAGCPCTDDDLCVQRQLRCRADDRTCVWIDGKPAAREGQDGLDDATAPGGDDEAAAWVQPVAIALCALCCILIVVLGACAVRQHRRRSELAANRQVDEPVLAHRTSDEITLTYDTPQAPAMSTVVIGAAADDAAVCDVCQGRYLNETDLAIHRAKRHPEV